MGSSSASRRRAMMTKEHVTLLRSVRRRRRNDRGWQKTSRQSELVGLSFRFCIANKRRRKRRHARARYGFFFGFSTSSDDGVKCKRVLFFWGRSEGVVGTVADDKTGYYSELVGLAVAKSSFLFVSFARLWVSLRSSFSPRGDDDEEEKISYLMY